MDMEDIACCKEAGFFCLEIFIDHRTLCSCIKRNTGIDGKLVFRNQTDREDHRITVVFLLRSRNRLHVLIHLCNGNACHTLISVDVCDRVAQIQRDSVVIQALFDVSRKSARDRLNLKYSLYMSAL